MTDAAARGTREALTVRATRCCIVGGGPAGAVLALLLVRQGIPTILIEEHDDFEREFRGDSIHPSVMEIMDELGLADRLLQLRHTKIHTLNLRTAQGSVTVADFSHLDTRFPYITFMPQEQFLEFITQEAARSPDFELIMGAGVRELIQEDGVVRGVRYRTHDGWHEVRALLTVGADGRFSRVRRLAGFTPIETSPPMDIAWFRLPRKDGDPEDVIAHVGPGHIAILINRFEYWQAGYVISKGSFAKVRAEGIQAFRQAIAELLPEVADRVDSLKEWQQVSLLSVESSRLPRWYRPGLLLIGDAAHVMSPVGGVGINYAIQDAVVAANVLSQPLLRGRMRIGDLAAVQRQRELPTRLIQALQTFIQERVLATTLASRGPLNPPPILRLVLSIPFVRALPARLIGLGIWRVHVRS